MKIRYLFLLFGVKGCSGLVSSGQYPVNVVLTREHGKNEKLRKELEEQSAQKSTCPPLCVIEVPSVAQVRDKVGELLLDEALQKEWDWIIVTSPEAATVLSDAIARTDCSRDLSIATVGAATAHALRGEIRSRFSPSKATASALASELPNAQSVLYPTSALAAPTLQETLERRGFRVQRIDAYTTEPAIWDDNQFNMAKAAHLVAFGSPSAVRVWVDRLGNSQEGAGIPVCIGYTTAKECLRLGFQEPIAHPKNPGLKPWASEIIQVASSLYE